MSAAIPPAWPWIAFFICARASVTFFSVVAPLSARGRPPEKREGAVRRHALGLSKGFIKKEQHVNRSVPKTERNLFHTVLCLAMGVAWTAWAMAEEPSNSRREYHELVHSFSPGPTARKKMERKIKLSGEQLAPYARETITNEQAHVRTNTLWAIGAVRDSRLLPLVVDRFLHDDSKEVRHAAADTLLWFFEKTPARNLVGEDTIHSLGQTCLERVKACPDERAFNLRLIGALAYAPAEDALVALWMESKAYEAGEILAALYAVNREQADRLLHAPDARERLKSRNDSSWFLALARSVRHNEKSAALIRALLADKDRRASGIRVPPGALITGAMMTGDTACRQWVLSELDNTNPPARSRSVVLQLQMEPVAILEQPELKQALVNAILRDDKMLEHFARIPLEEAEKGTVQHWLVSPGSPLRKE